jgi:diguanylate cyclase (GGDEF)-like protein
MLTHVFTFIAVVIATFCLLALTVSYIRFYFVTHRVRQADPEQVNPTDTFQLRVVQMLGGMHQSSAPFTVMHVAPQWPETVPENLRTEALDAVAERLRKTLRQTDTVTVLPTGQCAVLGSFGSESADKVSTRLHEKFAKSSLTLPSNQALRLPVCIGMAHHPEHGDRAQQLITASQSALQEALTSGTEGVCAAPGADAPATGESAPDTPPPRSVNTLLDEVTGVLRPERLGTALQKMVARQRKEGLGVSVVYFSIDLYPQYVSRYKQEAANQILKGFADLLSAHTRETDILARADEADFAVVMDCPPTTALLASQRLVAHAKRVPFRVGATSLRINVNAGVAGHPDHSGYPREMLDFARTAMETARQKGRSVSMIYHPSMNRANATTAPRLDRF